MNIIELAKNKAWCPDPWSELSSDTGSHYKLCCWSYHLPYSIHSVSPLEHWNSPEMKEVRKAMIAGDRDSLRKYCEACHIQENAGADSRRLRRLRELEYDPQYFDTITESIAKTIELGDGSAPAHYFHRVDLRIAGNLCNLRCVMCSPTSSSSIAEEMKRLGKLPNDTRTLTLPILDMATDQREQFWRDLEEILPRTRCLYFAGGEPFLSEAHYQVLDLAIRQGLNERIRLWYSTNLTTINTTTGRGVIDYLKQFKEVDLSVSVDNLYKKNDYIRYGSRFQKFIDNIQTVAQLCPHVRMEPSTCVSMLNILDLTEIHFFFMKMIGQHSFVNLLTSPWSLRATYLPPNLKKLALQRLTQHPDIFQSPIQWLKSPVEAAEQARGFAAFIQYIESLDKARGTKFIETFPEFAPYMIEPYT
jgi:sulfatase maturation enzyme AslB (radical SAM superfamily)